MCLWPFLVVFLEFYALVGWQVEACNDCYRAVAAHCPLFRSLEHFYTLAEFVGKMGNVCKLQTPNETNRVTNPKSCLLRKEKALETFFS